MAVPLVVVVDHCQVVVVGGHNKLVAGYYEPP